MLETKQSTLVPDMMIKCLMREFLNSSKTESLYQVLRLRLEQQYNF